MSKVTRLGPTRPVISGGSLSSGGGLTGPVVPGQVPTATGSNAWSWGSNIATVTVNGLTQVIGPHINFADGSNTVVTASSNTIRVHVSGVSSDPNLDEEVWMPLTSVTSNGPLLVWDGDDSLIPTLVPV